MSPRSIVPAPPRVRVRVVRVRVRVRVRLGLGIGIGWVRVMVRVTSDTLRGVILARRARVPELRRIRETLCGKVGRSKVGNQ